MFSILRICFPCIYCGVFLTEIIAVSFAFVAIISDSVNNISDKVLAQYTTLRNSHLNFFRIRVCVLVLNYIDSNIIEK